MSARPYTVASLAEHWGCSDTFVYDELHAGRLQGFKLGRKLWRIRPEAVEEYECRGSLGGSESSPANDQAVDPTTGRGASSGLTSEERTASRLARQIDLPRKPRLVSSGPGAP